MRILFSLVLLLYMAGSIDAWYPHTKRILSRRSLLASVRLKMSPTEEDSSEIISSISLVGGTTVGAGILALPSFASESGFVPSSLALIICWVYQIITGLLIAEVAANLQRSGSGSIGYLGCIQKVLGEKVGKVAGVLYLFLHWVLLIAYTSEGGELLGKFLNTISPAGFVDKSIVENVIGPTAFSFILFLLTFFGTETTVDSVNSLLCLTLLVLFSLLITVGIPHASLDNLVAYQNYPQMVSSIPIFLLSLVFHNIVPTVAQKLQYDKERVNTAIVSGTAVPMIMFIVWDAVVLGLTPGGRLPTAAPGDDPVLALFSNLELPSFLDNPLLGGLQGLIGAFSVVAITTSFIGFVYGLNEFFADALAAMNSEKSAIYENEYNTKSESEDSEGNVGSEKSLLIFGLTFMPPLAIAVVDPGVFLNALDLAGTFGISVLFGAMPALMAYKSRELLDDNPVYRAGNSNSLPAIPGRIGDVGVAPNALGSVNGNLTQQSSTKTSHPYVELIPGGNALLLGVFGSACAVILEKVSVMATTGSLG